MSEFKNVDPKRLERDFHNLRNDWKRGVEEKKLTKKYKYLREASESLYRKAMSEGDSTDKILLRKLMSVIESRQTGTLTKREAEESFGSSLGDVYVKPVKEALAEEEAETEAEI